MGDQISSTDAIYGHLGKEAMKSERTTGDIRVANLVISCTGTTILQ